YLTRSPRAPLWGVGRGPNLENTGAISRRKSRREASERLINLFNFRNLPLAALRTAAKKHEQPRVVEAEFIVQARGDRPVPAAARLPRERRVVIGPAVNARAGVDVR